jgi:hypothetical protein
VRHFLIQDHTAVHAQKPAANAILAHPKLAFPISAMINLINFGIPTGIGQCSDMQAILQLTRTGAVNVRRALLVLGEEHPPNNEE